MGPAEVVRGFWDRTQARDWAGVGALLAEDVRLEWPATRELLTGRAAVVAPPAWRESYAQRF